MLLCSLVGSIFVYKMGERPISLSNQVVESTTMQKRADELIYFEDFGAEDFTCTGLTWDSNNQSFWVGDYGAMSPKESTDPRIVEVSQDLKEIKSTVNLSKIVKGNDNLQGIAYDDQSDTFWVAVGDTIKNISKEGILLSTLELGRYAKYKSNGICYDSGDDTLWILCYSNYLLHYDKNGKLIDKYNINYSDQDQICLNDDTILATVGADYHGNENYVISIDKKNGDTQVLYRLESSCAIEGICLIGGKMYITNDGLYHHANILNSYIAVYDI